MAPVPTVEKLNVGFATPDGDVHAVRDLSFELQAGETLGIVGESGSGKSQSVLSLLGLLAANGSATGAARFDGRDLLAMPLAERRRMLGADIAMIFQDPMASLNPCFTVAYQLMETLAIHEGGTKAQRRARALRPLRDVEIPDAERRLDAFPHQLSGGMSQRVMVAMAIACNPRLLIADEPTTALDVTVQAQILELIERLQSEFDTAVVVITHDLGVVAEMADEIAVMYAGRIVERGPVAGRRVLDLQTDEFISAVGGLIVGLLIGLLLGIPMGNLPEPYNWILPIGTVIVT